MANLAQNVNLASEILLELRVHGRPGVHRSLHRHLAAPPHPFIQHAEPTLRFLVCLELYIANVDLDHARACAAVGVAQGPCPICAAPEA